MAPGVRGGRLYIWVCRREGFRWALEGEMKGDNEDRTVCVGGGEGGMEGVFAEDRKGGVNWKKRGRGESG
jgi:hypothetical protein